jgi:hypothetical protein
VYQHLDPGPVPPASSPATSRVMRVVGLLASTQ